VIFGLSGSAPEIQAAASAPIPWLSEIPFIGQVLFPHSLLVYVAFALAPLVWWLLHRTPSGLSLRAVGENAGAADSAGVRVQMVRYAATIAGGALAGLAGAYFSTLTLNVFLEGRTGAPVGPRSRLLFSGTGGHSASCSLRLPSARLKRFNCDCRALVSAFLANSS
jgi:ABC-type uncharacterized transport system permease subunit